MSADKKTLIRRAAMIRAIRRYFDDHGFVEVQTPTRIQTPALEDYIDAIPSDDQWLRTSPELHMKRLVAEGMERIYQIGPCFRAEELGRRHRTEFTMLEWYQANANYRDLIQFTKNLVSSAADALNVPEPTPWTEISVDTAFREAAGIGAADACRDGCFDEVLIDRVEPALADGAFILIDYPAKLGALARVSPKDPTVAERWELYLNGLEIANTYSELIDPTEQRRRFESTANLRRNDGRADYGIDERFMEALAHMPPTAGSALGIDRLFMALTGIDDIGNAMAFGGKGID